MEARAPVPETLPPAFGTADVTRYVIGAVLEQIMDRLHGGECVYTRKQHAEVCKRFGCAETGTTPAFERGTLKWVIEQGMPLLMAGKVKCDVVDRGGDLLHIKWTSMARVVVPIPQHPNWNRSDYPILKRED